MRNGMSYNLDQLKSKPLEEIFKLLNSSEKGLSNVEVDKRLKEFGYNEIPEKKLNPILKFLRYFYGPIPAMIFLAALLSLVLNDYADFWIIFGLLILNGVVAFFEEHAAENAIDELKKRLALKSIVLRDGKWQEIDAKHLVPGDIVKLDLGCVVPADGIIISDKPVDIDESALTGESLPVTKHKKDPVYSGSIVKRGKGLMLVVNTGVNTFFGKTAKLVENVKETSDYQKQLIKIGYYLMKIAIVMVIITFLYGWFMKHDSPVELIKFAMILLVASIPAALPTVLSLTMVISAKRLIRKHAIVKKLVALEELAGVDVLLSDKTGTLTKNQLSIVDIVNYNTTKEEVMLYAALCSDFNSNDSIDQLIKHSINEEVKHQLNNFSVLEFVPFDPQRKRADAKVKINNKTFYVTKGAPQIIAKLVPKNDAEFILKKNEEFSEKGYRVLAVAKKEANESKYELVGLLLMLDPPRDDAKEVIQYAKSMGVKVKLVSGDNLAIVKTIANILNIGKHVVNFREFIKNKDVKEITTEIENVDAFAEVFPEDKYSIVKAHQKKHKVAMTGDGVNDAPALKAANVGIAVANATDAAKAAASIVLTEPGINVIVDAIEESRKLFNRMKSYAMYRIAETIRVILFITFSILLFNFYPLTPVMLLLLAFLNDLAILAIATDNVKISNKPEQWNMKELLTMSTVLGISGVISSFILFVAAKEIGLNESMIQTILFLKLTVAGHLTLFVTRTKGPFYETMPSKTLLTASLSTITIAILLSHYGIFLTPVSWKIVSLVLIYSIAWFPINDMIKQMVYKRLL